MGLSKDRPSIVPAGESVSRTISAERLRSASFVLRDGNAIPIRGPSPWFLTTSTAYSSSTLRPYFRPLPILGFTVFLPLRNGVLTMRLLPFEAFPPPTAAQLRRRISVAVRVRVTGRPSPIVPFTANLAPSSFLGPRGLAPSSGPLPARPLPAVRARCSPGLVRSARPPSWSPPPHRER